jgi:hypothetical protein
MVGFRQVMWSTRFRPQMSIPSIFSNAETTISPSIWLDLAAVCIMYQVTSDANMFFLQLDPSRLLKRRHTNCGESYLLLPFMTSDIAGI